MVVWNLDNLYPASLKDEKKKELEEAVNSFIAKKDLLKPNISSDDFNSLLENYESLGLKSSVLNARIDLSTTENIIDSNLRKESQEISAFLTELQNKLIYFTHFFKNLDEENANRLIKSSGRFTYYLQQLRRAIPHTRTESEEQIINIKDLSGPEALDSIRNIVVGNFKFPFKGEELLEPEISVKRKSEDPREREEAYTSHLNVYKQSSEILGEIYKNICLDWYNESVDIRHHKNSISARNFANTLPDEVVDLVLDVIRSKRGIYQEYFKLKAKTLGYKNSRYHIYAPFTLKDKKEYSYETAKEITLDVYKKFSPKAFELVKNIFDANHVHSDVIPNKRSGAFCYSYSKDGVPYVMLNHMNKLDDVSTMCHEMGHGLHGQLAAHTNQFTFHSALPLAETASIFGELLLSNYLKDSASVEEQKYLLFEFLDGTYASIMRQSYFALFEIQAHDLIKKGTTVDELHKVFHTLHKEQFGEDMELPQAFEHEWLLMPHIFNSPFYVYAYAFANLVVLALYHKYEQEGESFVPKFLDILSAGGDADISDILAKADIDVTDRFFWEGAFDKIESELERLKSLL